MNKLDYYKILGISRNSNLDDIKMAYKKLAMKYHPDRNPNDPKSEEKFKEIKEAYENLTNKNKINSFENQNNFNFSEFSNSESSLDDIFNIIFNKNFKKKNDNTISYILEIDLEYAIYGANLTVKIPQNNDCEKCFGKGIKPGSNLKICGKCKGSGLYNIMQGIFNFKQKCGKCDGKGYTSSDICSYCLGLGKIKKLNLYNLTVPKCSDNNTKINIYRNDKSNQFSIYIVLKSHYLYQRKNLNSNDLTLNFFLDFIKIIIGGYLKIPTFYGFILYKLSSRDYQNFKSYKISNFGLNFGKNFGDLYLNLIVNISIEINFYQWLIVNKFKLTIQNFKISEFDRKINTFRSFIIND